MERCCAAEPRGETGVPLRCRACGNAGPVVERITVKALLRPEALARVTEPEHRFCATAACPVVYFGREETFDRTEVAVPVFQKEPEGDRTVCYCFAVSETDIRRELVETGHSTVRDRVTALVKAGRCACEVRNPQGSCCLGNIAAAATAATVAGSRTEDVAVLEVRGR